MSCEDMKGVFREYSIGDRLEVHTCRFVEMYINVYYRRKFRSETSDNMDS